MDIVAPAVASGLNAPELPPRQPRAMGHVEATRLPSCALAAIHCQDCGREALWAEFVIPMQGTGFLKIAPWPVGASPGTVPKIRSNCAPEHDDSREVTNKGGCQDRKRRAGRPTGHSALFARLAPRATIAAGYLRDPDGDHHVNTKHVNEDFEKVLKKLNISVGKKNRGFTLHSLRSSFKTICINASIPREVVDIWQGHASRRPTAADGYYKLSDEKSQEFMAKVPFGDS
jgi:hypothetical protein